MCPPKTATENKMQFAKFVALKNGVATKKYRSNFYCSLFVMLSDSFYQVRVVGLNIVFCPTA